MNKVTNVFQNLIYLIESFALVHPAGYLERFQILTVNKKLNFLG